MKSSSTALFLLIAIILALIPISLQQGNFAGSCSDISLGKDGVLRARCATFEEDQYLIATKQLAVCITNRGGQLAWLFRGGYIGTCRSCILLDGGKVMGCNCLTFNGQHRYSEIRINDRIRNVDGHLYC